MILDTDLICFQCAVDAGISRSTNTHATWYSGQEGETRGGVSKYTTAVPCIVCGKGQEDGRILIEIKYLRVVLIEYGRREWCQRKD